MDRVFLAKVTDGKLVFQSLTDWYVHLRRLNYKNVEVIVREAKKERSKSENNFYWGVVVKMIADHTGYTRDEAHAILKSMFLKVIVGRFEYVRSTKTLNTSEMEEYLADIRQWASLPNEQGGLGLYVPAPNEVIV
jgi:hypothetical protein